MAQPFVPFAEVKRAVSLEAVLTRYDLGSKLTPKGANLVGPCPFCKSKSTRQFQVNLAKNAWYCFGCKAGGNVLDFVARREGVSVRAAAMKLDRWFDLGLAYETEPEPTPLIQAQEPVPPKPPPLQEESPPAENPSLTFTLKTLDPNHASLAGLGFASSTLESIGAGYCSKGLLKGRLAIPIYNAEGELLAYTGLALTDSERPKYLFPPKFSAALEVFNQHRVAEFSEEGGPLYLAPEIEGILRLFEAGHSPVLGLFDGSLSPRQEEAIAASLASYDRLILVGEAFSEATVARLARHTSITWLSDADSLHDCADVRKAAR
jgi:DNA primase